MKVPPKTASTRDKFVAFGSRLLVVPKQEIEEREKAWQATRPKKRRKRKA
jgi:hypothetical protein